MNKSSRKPAHTVVELVVVVLHNKNPPTPCLWQAPASTQKTKKENQAGHSSERTVEGQHRGRIGKRPSAPGTWPAIMKRAVEGEAHKPRCVLCLAFRNGGVPVVYSRCNFEASPDKWRYPSIATLPSIAAW